ncbi:hypothetical protein [Pseudomonas sp. Marseille-Q8238]
MVWTLDKSDALYKLNTLTAAAQEKFDRFQNAIHQQGMHPKHAAELVGDSDYKCLNGSNLFQFRLDGFNRVTLDLNSGLKVVKVVQVGGHS